MKLRAILFSLLTLLMTCGLFATNAEEARAEGWVVNAGAGFWMDNWPVVSEEYVFGDKTYYGVMIDIQPEYRFTKWFGLGLDLGLGGGQADTKGWERASGKMGIGEFQFLLTAKFIAALRVADLWGELGFGGLLYFGDFMSDDGEWYRHGLGMNARIRAGVTFNVCDNFGLGVHAAFGYRPIENWGVEAGVHFTYRYGN